jgi:3-isopropylmalate dehydrogenase
MHPNFKIGILEGDDIGHEVVPETVKVMRRAAEIAGLAIEWHDIPIGRRALDTLGSTLPPDTLQKL